MSFCSYPFKHLSIGQDSKLRACCVASPFDLKINDVEDLSDWWRDHASYKELRDSHRRNEKHSICRTCWVQEDKGWTSMRQRVTTEKDTDLEQLKNIEITGGRLCNLACRMCTPTNSNQIERENRPWFRDVNRGVVNWLDDEEQQEKLLDILMTPSLQSIYFTGGEPQLMPCYQQLLNKWSERRDLGTMAMHMNTNCTVFNEQFWKSVNLFYHKQIDFSIDAVGDIYESIRFTDFNRVKENMLQIRDYLSDRGRNIFSLIIVTQLANVDQGPELQELYNELTSLSKDKLGYQVLLLPVTDNPEWLWTHVPLQILQESLDRLQGMKGLVALHYQKNLETAMRQNSFSQQHAQMVLKKEQWFKSNKGTCLWDVKPDWYEIYKDNS